MTPFPFEQARVVEEELGLTLEQLYVDFEETPIAAASIGQVHRATLPNGRQVVVKVQRPNAPRRIEADLELMYQLASIARGAYALEFIDTGRRRRRVRALDQAGASTTASRPGTPSSSTGTSPATST